MFIFPLLTFGGSTVSTLSGFRETKLKPTASGSDHSEAFRLTVNFVSFLGPVACGLVCLLFVFEIIISATCQCKYLVQLISASAEYSLSVPVLSTAYQCHT